MGQMQQENERSRVVVSGRRINEGDTCTLVVIHETGGSWSLYPHGFGKFGVRLPEEQAVTVARAILDTLS